LPVSVDDFAERDSDSKAMVTSSAAGRTVVAPNQLVRRQMTVIDMYRPIGAVAVNCTVAL
jgi:hypothetical protein